MDYNNYDFVFKAVKENSNALNYASSKLKNNYDLGFFFDEKNPNIKISKAYFNIVFEAVKNNGYSLEYTSDK